MGVDLAVASYSTTRSVIHPVHDASHTTWLHWRVSSINPTHKLVNSGIVGLHNKDYYVLL